MMPCVPASRTAGDTIAAASESCTAAAAQEAGAMFAGTGSGHQELPLGQQELPPLVRREQVRIERGQAAQAPEGEHRTGTGSRMRGSMKASATE